jgi:YggT family protein
MEVLVTLIDLIYYAIFILIFARIILSWVNVGSYQLREWIFRLTEPLLAPVRRILPQSAGLDFSPMIVLIGAWIIRELLVQILI